MRELSKKGSHKSDKSDFKITDRKNPLKLKKKVKLKKINIYIYIFFKFVFHFLKKTGPAGLQNIQVTVA